MTTAEGTRLIDKFRTRLPEKATVLRLGGAAIAGVLAVWTAGLALGLILAVLASGIALAAAIAAIMLGATLLARLRPTAPTGVVAEARDGPAPVWSAD